MRGRRVRVSLTKPYVDGIDQLIREGVYVNRSEGVKDALRMLFKHYELEILKA